MLTGTQGSTGMQVAVPPTLAAVGGGWTAVVARVGSRPVDGTTLGLIDVDGRLAGDVLAGLRNDPEAARRAYDLAAQELISPREVA